MKRLLTALRLGWTYLNRGPWPMVRVLLERETAVALVLAQSPQVVRYVFPVGTDYGRKHGFAGRAGEATIASRAMAAEARLEDVHSLLAKWRTNIHPSHGSIHPDANDPKVGAPDFAVEHNLCASELATVLGIGDE